MKEITKEELKEYYAKGFDETGQQNTVSEFNHQLEKRFKFVFIDLEAILYYVFQSKNSNPDGIIINYLELPEGAEALAAYYVPERMGFKVILYSGLFPIVPRYEEIPFINYKQFIVGTIRGEKIGKIE